MQKRGSVFAFLVFLFHTYARWKGTGKLCPNILWKCSKISPDRFEKYFQDLHTLGPYKEICYWFDLTLNGKDFSVFGALCMNSLTLVMLDCNLKIISIEGNFCIFQMKFWHSLPDLEGLRSTPKRPSPHPPQYRLIMQNWCHELIVCQLYCKMCWDFEIKQ